MITTVTFNPAIDKTITVEKFTPGAVNRVLNIQENIGGKGINVAKVLNFFGAETTAIGFIGEQNYSFIQQSIKAENLVTDFIPVDALTRTNTKIIDPSTHTTTDINEQGFTVNAEQFEQLTALVSRYAEKSEFMVFSGSTCKGLTPQEIKVLLESAQKKTKVVLDADGEFLKEGIKASPFLIKPNIHELESLLNRKFGSIDEIIKSLKELIKAYGITYVLLSMGEKGSLLVSMDAAYLAGILKVNVVSTVGAGDSMLAGFLFSFMKHKDPAKALQFAACTGSLAVSAVSTEAFKNNDIAALSHTIKLSKIE